MFKFFIFLVISLAFAYIAHFIFYIYDYWGNYMHIISVGFFAYLPFLAIQDKYHCFFKCLAIFTPVVILVYFPILYTKVNILVFWSTIIYMIFLGLAFCRHKYRAGKIISGQSGKGFKNC